MKLYPLLICVALFVANIEGYVKKTPKCVGQPIKDVCNLRRDLGHNKYLWCKEHAMSEMWYYNMIHNTCNKMIYMGCGGNFNRFCSEADCAKKCITTKKHG
ncbi:kunitz-type serine protease inhibitor HNTX-03141017 [Drosophila mojavensis]|uniref:BPTI/Kunitz inhibitor domain-containing protein n=1 Tax=Drosophila mojavensis TaxID=7230 RepID=A0A0Q9XL27_DROMO|nr:kunitz-type serine protease inhibitor HNTX-03141017 [Drosophila mojavensis]KRG06020.1 uncharacterized protein Dmoj_GI26603 [Drosophila mojavensis]